MGRQYYVYIMTNKNNTVLYTGSTNDLNRRVYEQKEKLVKGFTKKYNVNKLVYYEVFTNAEDTVLSQEKSRLKVGREERKFG